jgi:hypothetical protein
VTISWTKFVMRSLRASKIRVLMITDCSSRSSSWGTCCCCSLMTVISIVFLVLILVINWPRQTQIRRKTYRIEEKHQDKAKNTKRQEKAKNVKICVVHRSTMASIVPRWELLVGQEINRRKSEENLFILLRYISPWYDDLTWRPSWWNAQD